MLKRFLTALCFILIPVLAHSAANNFNFSLKNDGDKTVTQGASAFNTITASLVSGTAQAVSFTISGLPQNTTASLSSASCTPTPTCSTTLTISTSASTPTGAYTITVTGTATGGLHKKTSFSLTVTASSSFNFSLTNDGDKPNVPQGSSATSTITATLLSGTPQSVSFSASGQPTDADPPAFSPTACSPTCFTTLTISTATSTPAGTYLITVTGTGGGVTKTTSFTLTVSSGSPTGSCLQGTGPLLTLSGVRTAAYKNTSLADNTRIDASTAQILTADLKAVTIGGGSNLCFSGGELLGQQPPSTAWSTMHGVNGIYVRTVKPSLHLENTRVFDSGDGVSMDPGGINWTIQSVDFKYIRDDCVEDDFLYSGTIDDSLFDGCYDGISARTWSGQSPDPGDGSNNLIVMKNSLLRLQAMDAPYSGPLPNHNAFWKWDPKAPQVALYNNVFRADADSWEHSGSGMYMAPPPGKLADCENNLMVWLGAGPFPEPLPTTFNGKPCFTITTDQSVWDTAVTQWKANHPTTLSDVAAPIVSLFSPGLVGSPTLTGTVTLTATAVDDRDVAGVQFKLNGQPIGGEVTSESAPTKFTLPWDSHTKPNGTYTLTATARDGAGNMQTSTGVTVTISN